MSHTHINAHRCFNKVRQRYVTPPLSVSLSSSQRKETKYHRKKAKGNTHSARLLSFLVLFPFFLLLSLYTCMPLISGCETLLYSYIYSLSLLLILRWVHISQLLLFCISLIVGYVQEGTKPTKHTHTLTYSLTDTHMHKITKTKTSQHHRFQSLVPFAPLHPLRGLPLVVRLIILLRHFPPIRRQDRAP